GVGLPGGPTPSYGPQAAYPIVDTVGPTGGPAFNPWQPIGPTPVAGPNVGAFDPGQAPMEGPAVAAPAPTYLYNPDAHRPAPPPAAPAATPPPAATNRAITVTTPDLSPSSSKGSAVASIPFEGQSADLSDVAKSELDRIAKNLTDKGLRQIELRAFASGAD